MQLAELISSGQSADRAWSSLFAYKSKMDLMLDSISSILIYTIVRRSGADLVQNLDYELYEPYLQRLQISEPLYPSRYFANSGRVTSSDNDTSLRQSFSSLALVGSVTTNKTILKKFGQKVTKILTTQCLHNFDVIFLIFMILYIEQVKPGPDWHMTESDGIKRYGMDLSLVVPSV